MSRGLGDVYKRQLMGSTEASEKDEIGLAHVSISKDGEVFNEKTISFVAKAVNAVTDVIG